MAASRSGFQRTPRPPARSFEERRCWATSSRSCCSSVDSTSARECGAARKARGTTEISGSLRQDASVKIHFKILSCDAEAWLAQAHLVSAAILFGSIGFQAPSSLTLKLSAASTASSAWTLA